MPPRLARLLTSMHSSKWKMRYGAEFEALLTDIPISPLMMTDVAASILTSRRRALVVALGAAALVAACAMARQHPSINIAFLKPSPPPMVCIVGARPWPSARVSCIG